MDGGPALDFKTATPLFFFGAWCCFLYGMFFFCWVYFPKVTSKVKFTWRVFPFHSWAGNGILGWVYFDEPPKSYGSLKSFQGGGVDPQNLPAGFLWVFTSFVFFSYGGFLSRKHRLRERQICQIWVEVNDQRTSSTRDLDLSRSPI